MKNNGAADQGKLQGKSGNVRFPASKSVARREREMQRERKRERETKGEAGMLWTRRKGHYPNNYRSAPLL